jgi:CRP-like cAMP-binding protein
VQALETTSVHSISLDDLHWIHAHYPAFNAHTRELVQRHYLTTQEHLYAFHHRQPLDRYRWLLIHAPELILRVSHTHLASYMGMSLETLSRVKSRL